MSETPDEYEQKYMSGGEAVVRERRGLPRWMHALFGGLIGFEVLVGLVIMLAGSPAGWVNLMMGIPLAMIWMLFLYLRVTLTNDALHVQYGIMGPTIQLSQIQSVTKITYDWKKFGGWGIRYIKGITAYSTPGGNNEALRVEWTDEKGKAKKTVVTTDKAAEFVEQIQKRIASRAGGAQTDGSSGVRVAGVEPTELSTSDSDGAEMAESELVSGAKKQRE